jgi:hypothetical protein
MTTATSRPADGPRSPDVSSVLDSIAHLSTYHREHEKDCPSSPRELAVTLQRHARTLQALADHWSSTWPVPVTSPTSSPYVGAEDMNNVAARRLDGVLFMERQGRPPEIAHLIADLRTFARDQRQTGDWLAETMQSSWESAAALIPLGGLADMLAERHRIIASHWEAASMIALSSRILTRAADVLEQVDFAPSALRADLAGGAVCIARLYSAAELIAHAADLCSDSAGPVHGNEQRWRTFRPRVSEILDVTAQSPAD